MARLRVFFVTNRNHQPTNKKAVFGAKFNPDGVAALRYGCADFDASGDFPVLSEVSVYSETRGPTPTAGFTKQGSAGFLDDLRDHMRTGCADTIVFIHGFNVTFAEALDAASRISSQIVIEGKPVNVVLFSWPSDGKAVPFMSYYSDRDDARSSGAALARAFLKLVDFLEGMKEKDVCGRRLHLLAHSMGNYVLRIGLQALIAKDPRALLRVFHEIVMAAPDEDDDAFETDEKLRLLPRLARRVTVYHNESDRALLISDKTKANPDRLGADGPRMLDLLPKKVVVVDCSRVAASADALARHTFFINCPPVSADLLQTLEGVETSAISNRDAIRAERAYRIRG
jgi:esterase/lipase superfamily enzyme